MAALPCLRSVSGVLFDRIEPGGFRIIAALVGAVDFLELDLTITAGTDHHHSGRHVSGEAYDIRVKDLTVDQVIDCYNHLKNELGAAFTVLYECPTLPDEPRLKLIAYINPGASGAHLHIQVKKGTIYPPTEPASMLRA